MDKTKVDKKLKGTMFERSYMMAHKPETHDEYIEYLNFLFNAHKNKVGKASYQLGALIVKFGADSLIKRTPQYFIGKARENHYYKDPYNIYAVNPDPYEGVFSTETYTIKPNQFNYGAFTTVPHELLAKQKRELIKEIVNKTKTEILKEQVEEMLKAGKGYDEIEDHTGSARSYIRSLAVQHRKGAATDDVPEPAEEPERAPTPPETPSLTFLDDETPEVKDNDSKGLNGRDHHKAWVKAAKYECGECGCTVGKTSDFCPHCGNTLVWEGIE